MSEAEDFWAEVARLTQPQPEVKIFYRLYYDEQGLPLFYSMEDRPGNYIDIDAETYTQGSSHVRVIDGKLVKTERKSTISKLRPNSEGTPCDPRDVCIIVGTDRPHVLWKKTYES